MKKRLTLLLTFALCACLLCVGALAAEGDTVTVGGVTLSSSSPYAVTNDKCEVTTEDATEENYNIYWNAENLELTLRDANISGDFKTSGQAAIYDVAHNVTIVLEGSNNIASNYFGIYVSYKLTIKGDGSLQVNSGNDSIRAGEVVIDGAKLTLTADETYCAIYATNEIGGNGYVTIINKAELNLNSTSFAICSDVYEGSGKIDIIGSIVNILSAPEENAIVSFDGEINIDNSNVNITSEARGSDYPAVYGNKISIKNNSIVAVSSDGRYSLYSPEGMSIENSIVNVNHIRSEGALKVSRSWVDCTGSATGDLAEEYTDSVIIVGGSGKVIDNAVVPGDVVIDSGTTLIVPAGASLVIPEEVELTNEGELVVNYSAILENIGTIINNGVIKLNGRVEGGGQIKGGGIIHYPITIPETYPIELVVSDGGEAKTSLTNASRGSVITVTATPDEGYELAYITVDGERINGTKFTMPEHAVTVRVYFTTGKLPFADVASNAWYFDAVRYAYENGLMDGVSATEFNPDGGMTRGMVWAILARMDGETVTGSGWLDAARAWAVESGVSDGTDPNGLVTREQFATMLWRFAGEPASSYSLSAYADASSVSAWAETAMSWAVENGVISGVTSNTLVPGGTTTRAQCAAMLMRFASVSV